MIENALSISHNKHGNNCVAMMYYSLESDRMLSVSASNGFAENEVHSHGYDYCGVFEQQNTLVRCRVFKHDYKLCCLIFTRDVADSSKLESIKTSASLLMPAISVFVDEQGNEV